MINVAVMLRYLIVVLVMTKAHDYILTLNVIKSILAQNISMIYNNINIASLCS